MVTLADVMRWDAGPVEHAARRVRAQSQQLERIHDSVRTAHPAHWSGPAADASGRAHTTLQRSLDDLSVALRRLFADVAAAADEVADLVRDRDLWREQAFDRQVRVDPNGTCWDKAPAIDGDPEEQRQHLAERREALGAVRRQGDLLLARAREIDRLLVLRLGQVPWHGDDEARQPEPGGSDLPDGTEADFGYRIGEPFQPDLHFDEDFVWGSQEPTGVDLLARAKWLAFLAGARLLRADLDDATAAYARYWENTGEPLTIDYAEAYAEDRVIQGAVDANVEKARLAAQQFIEQGGRNFSTQSPTYGVGTENENWDKTLGQHVQWVNGSVTVDGNKATMTVVIHAADRYNFNAGQADKTTGLPDNANGRFQEVGWARSFDTAGSMTKTITWDITAPGGGPADTTPSVPNYNPGREDRADRLPGVDGDPRGMDESTGRVRLP